MRMGRQPPWLVTALLLYLENTRVFMMVHGPKKDGDRCSRVWFRADRADVSALLYICVHASVCYWFSKTRGLIIKQTSDLFPCCHWFRCHFLSMCSWSWTLQPQLLHFIMFYCSSDPCHRDEMAGPGGPGPLTSNLKPGCSATISVIPGCGDRSCINIESRQNNVCSVAMSNSNCHFIRPSKVKYKIRLKTAFV